MPEEMKKKFNLNLQLHAEPPAEPPSDPNPEPPVEPPKAPPGEPRQGSRREVHQERPECNDCWPGWISRMDKAGLERSMSRKGCSPDNSACEGLFGRIKNEMFTIAAGWV